VAAARAYLGRTAAQLGLPRRLWCADFMNLVESRVGDRGTGSRAAMSFASYGRRVSGPVAARSSPWVAQAAATSASSVR
jgi:hypothetical protein